ncbi:DUF2157 domain-containing protein [Halostreptopolyspora alba]|uniref:DUF2157 domain-containing protein n=1 Tax=Halostreptopolyspora alba TaxID=2487137 RepID=A0A3N0EAU6_9ACTN|nr:DUF2157 domain-containing protein [Nocardiopsaceae bacterium YIM 96095]
MPESHVPGGLDDSARDRALSGLVDQGVISTEQAVAVRDALETAAPGHRIRWAEIIGYIGGGLVLLGAIALVAASWEDLARAGQVTVLAVLTAALLAGGVATAGGPRALAGRHHRVATVRRRITGVLLALAAATSTLGIHVLTDEDTFLAGGAAGLVVAVAGYVALPSAVGTVACWATSVLLVGSIVEALDPAAEWLGYTLALLALGLLWGVLAGLGVLTHRRLGLGLGAAIALVGAHYPLTWASSAESIWGYALTLGLAALLFGYYRWERAGVLLVLGILAVTVTVARMVVDLTSGEVGAAAVLLVAGAVLLVASWAGIRLHQTRPPAG